MPKESVCGLELSARQMRRFRAMGAPKRGPRRKVGRFSREELMDYLKRGDIRSPKRLLKVRKDGDPLPSTYVKEFGSWRAATRSVFGVPILKPGVDKEYIIKAVVLMGIRTFDQYAEAHRRHPEVVPSYYWIKKNYAHDGTGRQKGKHRFSRLMDDVRKRNFKHAYDAYATLTRRLGKVPTLEDCDRAGVSLGILMPVFKDKKELDSHMVRLEQVRRRKHA